MPSDPRKILGEEGESLSAQYLERNGYRIVARNFSCKLGEIDLIAERKKELHFIEIKTRRSSGFIPPEEVVDGRKQGKIRRTAQVFLSAPGSARFGEYEIFLDVMAVILPSGREDAQIKHLVGAF